jgi:hypothetical protein
MPAEKVVWEPRNAISDAAPSLLAFLSQGFGVMEWSFCLRFEVGFGEAEKNKHGE